MYVLKVFGKRVSLAFISQRFPPAHLRNGLRGEDSAAALEECFSSATDVDDVLRDEEAIFIA
jgi:hypothetical protein